MAARVWWCLSLTSSALAITGCGALVALDHYRDCQGVEECARASGDAAAPDGADGGAETAPPTTCNSSADCTQGNAIVCSRVSSAEPARCASVATLVEGSVGDQCVILSDGALWCWGANDHGQLGRGAIGGTQPTPAPVTALKDGTKVVQAAMGWEYSCALTDAGDVWCWGDGTAGSGNGAATKIPLVARASAISGGVSQACALLVDGSIYCWGDNSYGDIGCANNVATPVLRTSPRLLIASTAMLTIEEVAVGLQGTCVRVTESGAKKLKCFGNAAWGILGDGTPAQGDKACQTSTVTGFGSLGIGSVTTADFAMCIRDGNSEIFCWGMNDVYYNVGLLDPNDPSQVFTSPRKLGFLGQNASQISIGWLHTCALGRTDGSVTCWGGSTHFETGIKVGKAQPTSIALPKQATATRVAAHRQFTCALMTDGQVLCWGNNETQAIGPTNKVGVDVPSPTAIVWP